MNLTVQVTDGKDGNGSVDSTVDDLINLTITVTEIIENPTYEWQDSLSDIVCALIDAGLRIEFLHEFPFTCYQALPMMERGNDG